MRLMLIAPRFDYEVLEFLERKFDGDPDIVVIRDRRAAERRKRPSMREVDRRGRERRARERGRLGFLIVIRFSPRSGS